MNEGRCELCDCWGVLDNKGLCCDCRAFEDALSDADVHVRPNDVHVPWSNPSDHYDNQ